MGVAGLMDHIIKLTYDHKKSKQPLDEPIKTSFPLDAVRHSEIHKKSEKEKRSKQKGGCCGGK